LPDELAGHGIGAGDINGDGRTDVVGPHGWAEAPVNPRTDRWIFHAEFTLWRDASIPILVQDVESRPAVGSSEHGSDTSLIRRSASSIRCCGRTLTVTVAAN